MIPLPASVRGLIKQNTHPGLALDKYVWSYDDLANPGSLSELVQRPTVGEVVRLSQGAPNGIEFPKLVDRWLSTTNLTKRSAFIGTTAGPMTLHLSRASALENAGLSLHPIYGFAYLPGSGLKGLAHAYACEIWLPSQPESKREENWKTICAVFGTAPSPWLKDLATRLKVTNPKDAAAGSIVFHDAWPAEWPKLVMDILNNHHSKYYGSNEPPGDWEDPIPVYFLAISPGTKYHFIATGRRDDVQDKLLEHAGDWLAGGLTTLGCGAKTASGYGHFKLDREVTKVAWSSVNRAEHPAVLELVTPAFLAGPNQESPQECDLRPATLRGVMRWWWRTMHAGIVDVATLGRLEAAIWGDTKCGGAVRITVEPIGVVNRAPFDREDLRSSNSLPTPPDRKTTQGLTYHSFGMNDNKTENGVSRKVTRIFAAPGVKWAVTFHARIGFLRGADAKAKPQELPAVLLLEQAKTALELLCRFGGVGAKGRKGFGSFADQPNFDLERIKKGAVDFRREAKCAGTFSEARADSPSLEQLLGPIDVPTGWGNHWVALDQLASAAQDFAKKYKHQMEKKALGLPRNVGRPTTGTFRPGRHVNARHASPIWYHFTRDAGGQLIARIVAFPAKELPTIAESRKLLLELLDHLKSALPVRFKTHELVGKRPASKVRTAPLGAGAVVPTGRVPKAGELVDAVLIEEKTKKGGWKAKHEPTGLSGPIQNTDAVPKDKAPGDVVKLTIAIVTAREISFKWPT